MNPHLRDPARPPFAGEVPAPRVTWEEVAAFGVTALFASFMWVRGLDLHEALITAVLTVSAVKVILVVPRVAHEGVKLLREIAQRLRSGQ